MHNKVVYRMARGLRKSGCVVLRFNFRGVNLSEGEYGRGFGEVEDARTCLDWLRLRYPDLPYSLGGFSFGSRIILRLGCGSGEARRLIAAGFPTVYTDQAFMMECVKPKIFIHSTRDQYGPKPELEALFARLPEPKRLVWVDAEDHFFRNALDEFERQIIALGVG